MLRRQFFREVAAIAAIHLGLRLPKAIESLIGEPEPEPEIVMLGFSAEVGDRFQFCGYSEPSGNGVFEVVRVREDGAACVRRVSDSPRTAQSSLRA